MKLLLTLLLSVFTMSVNAQSPAEEICDLFEGEIIGQISDRSFVGDAYECQVGESWDMLFMSKLNDAVLNDERFGQATEWKKTFVDTENYNRRSFSFKGASSTIVNLYIPFEKKTDHIIIAY